MTDFMSKSRRPRWLGLALAGALSACGGLEQESSQAEPLELGEQAMGKAEQELARHLDKAAAAAGLSQRAEFTRKAFQRDELGLEHTRFQQVVQGIPVFGGEAIVHQLPGGELFALTDDMKQGIQVDSSPKLSMADAVARATQKHGGWTRLTAQPQAELLIVRHEGKDHLAYKVQLRQEDGTHETSMPVLFVDAHSGDIFWQYDNLQTVSGTGSSLYSGTVTVETYLYSGSYYLEDSLRKVGTFDMRNGTSTLYRFSDANNLWDTTSQRAGVDAHFGAMKVYDYYKSVHGRNGINGSGGPGYSSAVWSSTTKLITSRVHYSTNYNNAYWNGSYMTYGDGDGTTFTPLVTLDICGHEMTHGVISTTANLTYSGESGALNESFADVFGAMVERYVKGESADTWKIGEGAYTPATAGDALRYMNEPHLKAGGSYTPNDDPDHYSERYTGTADNGGVHINSGIGNKAFYLVAKGGTHSNGGSMVGIGADKAAAIWYRALTAYMTSSTNFRGARTATLNAAAALYGSGSAEYNAVAQAWSLCGVL